MSQGMTAIPDQSVAELIDRFERDVIFDAHSLLARVNRSDAGKELIRRGKPALLVISQRLTRIQGPTPVSDLDAGWRLLLKYIAQQHNIPGVPNMNMGLPAWAAWAERASSTS